MTYIFYTRRDLASFILESKYDQNLTPMECTLIREPDLTCLSLYPLPSDAEFYYSATLNLSTVPVPCTIGNSSYWSTDGRRSNPVYERRHSRFYWMISEGWLDGCYLRFHLHIEKRRLWVVNLVSICVLVLRNSVWCFFVRLFTVYALLTEIPPIFVLYDSKFWSGVFLICIFGVSVWNGGGFYIEVFGRKWVYFVYFPSFYPPFSPLFFN